MKRILFKEIAMKMKNNIIAIRLKVHALLMDLYLIDGKDEKEASRLAMKDVAGKSKEELQTIVQNA